MRLQMKRGNPSDQQGLDILFIQKKRRKIINREIWNRITETCKKLDESFVSLLGEAEKKKDINFVVQANTLKRTNEETEEQRKQLEETLKAIIEKKEKALKNRINQLDCVDIRLFFSFHLCICVMFKRILCLLDDIFEVHYTKQFDSVSRCISRY